jgi:riboflavin biosynthesis pyrimidine reductase
MHMRQLYPPQDAQSAGVDIAEAYLPAPLRGVPLPEDRPWVTTNMVTSVDGAVTVAGRSGGLSVPGDREIFVLLRSMADIVLVGAGTVRAERYGPVRLSDALLAARQQRGQSHLPRLAVVTAAGDLPADLPLFDPETRGEHPVPLVITSERGRDQASALGDNAEFVVTGRETVDLVAALAHLRGLGAAVVLCEGGPLLNASLLAKDLLDELCLTFAPLAASGPAGRIIGDDRVPERPTDMTLAHLLEHEGALFSRWGFSAASAATPSPGA